MTYPAVGHHVKDHEEYAPMQQYMSRKRACWIQQAHMSENIGKRFFKRLEVIRNDLPDELKVDTLIIMYNSVS